MNYQQAKKIRGEGYISHLTEKLSEGQKLGSAIKSTISEKTKATSVGIKEKFDPLNIAKFMTGGSKFAPALLGSMTGRKKEDIQYFSGSPKAKNVDETATKINALESDNKVIDILLKIYDLLKSTNEEDKKRKELENNKKEEYQLEKQKRHKELIDALNGKKQISVTAVTATKEEKGDNTGGLLGGIIGIVTGLIDDAIKGVMSVIEGITDFIKSIVSSFGGLSTIGKLLFGLGRFLLMTPLGLAITAGAGIAYAIWQLWKSTDEEQTKKALGGQGEGQADYMPQLPSYDEEQKDKALKAKAAEVDKKGIANSSLEELDAKRQLMIAYGDPRAYVKKGNATDAEKAKAKFLDDIESEIKNRNSIPEELRPKEATKKEAKPRQQAGPELMNQISDSVSKKFNDVQKQNSNLNLPKPISSNEMTPTNNSVKVDVNKDVRKVTIPSVRNDEGTFQDMVFYNTRIV
jgi:hypothetical protein